LSKWTVGQAYSTSRDCGSIRFVGGPFDGQCGLYDHNNFSSIGFADTTEKVTYEYTPAAIGRSWDYIYKGPYYWSNVSDKIEAAKKEGIRKHLFEVVGNCLWTAKTAAEHARQTEGARYKNFKQEVLAARKALDDAEAFHAELLKYS
jgi:hypothetical protein